MSMNLMHLKYAVEVASTHSISKAAENLYMNQPNLSRAIKELEESLGVQLFNRTSKGITLTHQGEDFIIYAQRILYQINEIETLFREGKGARTRFSVSVPRATYICEAFSNFAKGIDRSQSVELFYKETNAVRAIRNILDSDYNLGIIRYQSVYDQQFRSMLEEKGLEGELVFSFRHVALLNRNDPLAKKEVLHYTDLADYVEIAHADPYVPSMPMSDVQKGEYLESIDKRIFVFERASQFMLLRQLPRSFTWVSPIPEQVLEIEGLVQRECVDERRVYKDVLIYKKNYIFSDMDDAFVSELWRARSQSPSQEG